jgi:hypothetical protein
MGLYRQRKNIDGSVIEPVIAIVILITTFGMAFTILTKLNSATPVKAINKANEMISNEIFETFTNSNFIDKEVKDGAFQLEKEVYLDEKSDIIEISYHVYDWKRKLIASKTIHKTKYSIDFSEVENNR